MSTLLTKGQILTLGFLHDEEVTDVLLVLRDFDFDEQVEKYCANRPPQEFFDDKAAFIQFLFEEGCIEEGLKTTMVKVWLSDDIKDFTACGTVTVRGDLLLHEFFDKLNVLRTIPNNEGE